MKIKKLLLVMVMALTLCACGEKKEQVVSLPKPEDSGVLGVDANVNVENIEGDAYLSGFVEGFEVVPLPYLVNVTGLPEAVGDTYKGKTLFTVDDEGKYVANYEESMDVLEYLFPKDKTIFLMCGGGGYAGMTKTMLVSLGWDEEKIYNTGGYWYYEGENNVIVKNDSHKEVTYDFWKVAYHDIDFEQLHEVK